MNIDSYKRIAELFGAEVLAAFKVVAEVDAAEFVPLRNMLDIAVSQEDVRAQFDTIMMVFFAAEGLISTLHQMESLSESASQDGRLVERSPASIARRCDAIEALFEAIRSSPEVAALSKAIDSAHQR